MLIGFVVIVLNTDIVESFLVLAVLDTRYNSRIVDVFSWIYNRLKSHIEAARRDIKIFLRLHTCKIDGLTFHQVLQYNYNLQSSLI